MKTSQSGLDEIVFEHRNKAYGAYVLRKDYNTNLLKAFAGVFFLFLLLFGTQIISLLFRETKLIDTLPGGVITIIDIPLTPIIPQKTLEIPAAPEKPITELKTISYAAPKIVKDLSESEMPPNDKVTLNNIGKTTTDGAINLGSATINKDETVEPVDETPQIYVPDMPKFIGGETAMMTYMQRSMIYPPIAKQEGISGTVYVKFIIDKNGDVTGVSVLKGIGYGCDEEAMRVIRAMPKWKPGSQNGKFVNVQFTYPISFKLSN
jgi:protein TonB